MTELEAQERAQAIDEELTQLLATIHVGPVSWPAVARHCSEIMCLAAELKLDAKKQAESTDG